MSLLPCMSALPYAARPSVSRASASTTAAMPAARVSGVAAGLHLLVTLPGDVDDAALADDLRDAGVLVHPVSWHRRLPGPPGLVLGYASHPPDRLREAAATIARITRK